MRSLFFARFLFLMGCLLVATGCVDLNSKHIARQKAEALLDAIGKGTAGGMFPPRYFPPDVMGKILPQLQDTCDFAHRKGVFVNDYYEKNLDGIDRVTFIYEYYLRCDSLRFLLTYLLDSSIDVCNLRVESIKVDNPKILDGSRRLWKGSGK